MHQVLWADIASTLTAAFVVISIFSCEESLS